MCTIYSYRYSKSSMQNKNSCQDGPYILVGRKRQLKHAFAMEKNTKQVSLQCQKGEGIPLLNKASRKRLNEKSDILS